MRLFYRDQHRCLFRASVHPGYIGSHVHVGRILSALTGSRPKCPTVVEWYTEQGGPVTFRKRTA